MSGYANGRDPSGEISDSEVWRRARDAAAPDDDASRLLDCAAYADGSTDEDERQLVTQWLANDPGLADDLAAATRAGQCEPEPASPAVLQRAMALVPGSADVIPFPSGRRSAPVLGQWSGWGSLVAAMAVASWLGFTLGVDTARSWAVGQGDDTNIVRELLDPSSGLLRDLSDGAQT